VVGPTRYTITVTGQNQWRAVPVLRTSPAHLFVADSSNFFLQPAQRAKAHPGESRDGSGTDKSSLWLAAIDVKRWIFPLLAVAGAVAKIA
jgi:hypothetical protein